MDASAVGAGVVLLQEGENHIGRPDSYYSKVLKGKSCVIEKEAFVLLLILQPF